MRWISMDIDSCSRSRPSFTFEDDAVLGGPHLYAHLSRSMMQWIDSIIHLSIERDGALDDMHP